VEWAAWAAWTSKKSLLLAGLRFGPPAQDEKPRLVRGFFFCSIEPQRSLVLKSAVMCTTRPSHPQDLDRLFEIWRSAVEATHHFLSATDVDEIGRLVRDAYLPAADVLVAVSRARPQRRGKARVDQGGMGANA
jgi:hypothetical protein